MDSKTLTYDIVTFIATHVSNVLKLLKLTETNAFNEAKKIKAYQIKAVVVWFDPWSLKQTVEANEGFVSGFRNSW